MRRVIFSLLFLAATPAHAQGVQRLSSPTLASPLPAIASGVPAVALRMKFDVPGCYPSGTKALTSTGAAVTVVRASTLVCAGVGTCQPNQLCVDALGLSPAPVAAAESITVAWPLGAAWSGGWAIAGTYQPSGAWAPASESYLWMIGGGWAANTAKASIAPTGRMWFQVWDQANTVRSAATDGELLSSLAAGSEHRIVNTSASEVWLDGAKVFVTLSGEGTNVIAPFPALRLASAWPGHVRDLMVCRSGSAPVCKP